MNAVYIAAVTILVAAALPLERNAPPRVVSLSGDERQAFEIDSSGPSLLRVRNDGIDTLLSFEGVDGNTTAVASWGGTEGEYLFLVESTGVVLIEPVEKAARPGRFHISLDALAPDDQVVRAYRLIREASAMRLAQYYGGLDRRVEAAKAFAEASQILARSEIVHDAAIAAFEVGVVFYELEQYDQAAFQLRKAADWWSGIGRRESSLAALNLLGLIYWRTGQLESAEETFSRHVALRRSAGDELLLAQSLNNLGLVRRDLSRPHEASQPLREALEIYGFGSLVDSAFQDPEPWSFLEAFETENLPVRPALSTLNNLAMVEEDQGRVLASSRLYQSFVELSQGLVDPDRRIIALNNLAMLNARMGELEQGLVQLKLAESLLSNVSETRLLATVYSNLGYTLLESGDLAAAYPYLRLALDRRPMVDDPSGRFETLSLLASYHRQQGEIDKAFAAASLAVEAAEESGRLDAAVKAKSVLARTLVDQQKFKEAVLELDAINGVVAQTSIRIQTSFQMTKGWALLHDERYEQACALFSASALLSEQAALWLTQAEALAAYAACLLARGDSDVEQILVIANEATSKLDQLRSALPRSAQRRRFAEAYRDAYSQVVIALSRLGRLEDAWKQLDTLQKRRVEDSLVGANTDAPEKRALRQRLATLLDDNVSLADIGERRRQVTQLVRQFETQTDTTDQHRGIDSDGTAGIRWARGSGYFVVNYQVTELGGIGLALSDDSIVSWVLPKRSELEKKVLEAKAALANPNSRNNAALNALAVALLPATIEQSARPIVFVTDGLLSALPFAALPTRSGQPIGLVRPVSQVVSGAFEATQPRHATHYSKLPITIAAIESTAAGGQFSELPNTVVEATTVGRIWPEPATILLNEQATVDRITALAGEPGILHLATHGNVGFALPELSGLVLHDNNVAGLSLLRALDIASIDVASPLVVLSACDTASNRDASRGVASIAQAFRMAGARSVVASLWKVDDVATARFMTAFYSRLATDHSPAAALTGAREDFLADPATRHPYYWAPFILVGSDL